MMEATKATEATKGTRIVPNNILAQRIAGGQGEGRRQRPRVLGKGSFFVLLATALCALVGCRVVEVENRGDGQGWRVYHNQHWMATRADTITATVQPGGAIRFTMGGLNTEPSDELRQLVEASLTGVTELAAKVGAAIATSGGSVAGEGAYAAIKSAIASYLAKGGSVANATVECTDDGCAITDGTVTETCAGCVKGLEAERSSAIKSNGDTAREE